MSLIQLDGIEKTYRLGERRVPALRGLNLRIDAGELLAVWGPSGSGKSTLCNLIGLLDTPTAGTVAFEGRATSGLGDDLRADLRGRRMGFIFQGFNLIPVLTAIENVMLPLQIGSAPSPDARTRAAALLADLGLGGHLDHRPDRLSGGQQQRVAIARALITRPALVIADEPTANLDTETAMEIIARLRTANRESGTTLLISTHDQRLLDRVDRRVLLRDGRIVEDARSAPGEGR
jgi:putative ABC transport system ATP-binding protein